ncbi:MerR family transcriptional regulator [Priestia megaterium]|uniref:helix-turn-helix domain-containing protein n=1 Tax=Priestia megaterium TaxID=1404 RepID=UPI001C247921|nr:MerR family transcriptional regulator [Priestia megaterium]MBU8757658.1 MerR family transcriptional regulator [Priestia megaterium]
MLKVVPTERTYDSSTFAEKLGITPSTLRNYKSQFTKGGITFKNNKGKTIYTENNLHMFSAMLDLHKQGGMTIAECVHAVLSVQDSQDSIQDSIQDSQDNFQESVITLKQYEDIIKRIEIQEQELQKCKAQIERRDRQVTELMRQMQELRKQASYKRAWWMFWKN